MTPAGCTSSAGRQEPLKPRRRDPSAKLWDMSSKEPQPAPPTVVLAAIVGNLNDLLATEGAEDSDRQLRETFHRAAMDNLELIAAALGVDWDQEVLPEDDRRAVVAE